MVAPDVGVEVGVEVPGKYEKGKWIRLRSRQHQSILHIELLLMLIAKLDIQSQTQ